VPAPAALFRAKAWALVPGDQSLISVTIESLGARGAELACKADERSPPRNSDPGQRSTRLFVWPRVPGFARFVHESPAGASR
jgi:hypothetical protein